MKSILVLLSFLIFSSCSHIDHNLHEKDSQPTNSIVKKTTSPKYNSVLEVLNDTVFYHTWLSSDYYPNLNFAHHSNKVIIQFDGQCEYTFPVSSKGNKITAYYVITEDCTHDIGLKESFGLVSIPKPGSPFITFTLIKASTLKANYLFNDWTDSVNARNPNYPCFVEQFHPR